MSGQHHHPAAVGAVPAPDALAPRRLELSVDPNDGSLLVVPLSHVLVACTDALYNDIYNMAHGELEVATVAALPSDDGGAAPDADAAASALGGGAARRTDKMSNLSFAQRRHELTHRLVQHARALQQAAALCAAHAGSDLAAHARLAGAALRRARAHWRHADEAQDALYFGHDPLFAARRAPQDLCAALDVLLARRWLDLPTNLRLAGGPAEEPLGLATSGAREELGHAWELVVWRKLLLGEVGYGRRQTLLAPQLRPQEVDPVAKNGATTSNGSMSEQITEPLWRLVVTGGIVRLHHGKPKQNMRKTGVNDSEPEYPIMAVLTVFSDSANADEEENAAVSPEWTLLSLDVRVGAKTGEFTHQLETTHRQRYDLHRLAARAMAMQEASHRAQTTLHTNKDSSFESNGAMSTPTDVVAPARPLQAMFEVAHSFLLSWQLELLSAQAQALRRGAWGSTSHQLQVSPLWFADTSQTSSSATEGRSEVLGRIHISFWKVDDAYGPPAMGELTNYTAQRISLHFKDKHPGERAGKSQFVLSIRAEVNVGIRISMSGGQSMMNEIQADPHLRGIADEIVQATSDPLCLSVGHALLSATRLCSIQRCLAVVEALQPHNTGGGTDGKAQGSLLPDWIFLSAHRGSIAVAARVEYHGVVNDPKKPRCMPILFRLECDTRTGSFVPTFARQTALLARLASNSQKASEALAVRLAALPPHRRRTAAASSSGRTVRSMFEGLVRSMNVLGERVGVGGTWNDVDDKSSMLRKRAVQVASADVKVSLIKCCGAASIYGLVSMSIGVGLGLDTLSDVAGEPIASLDGISFLPTPPLSIVVDQQLIEEEMKTSDGLTRKSARTQQRLCSFVASASDECLKIVPLDIVMDVHAPATAPTRVSVSVSQFKQEYENGSSGDNVVPPRKRAKLNNTKDPEDKCFMEDLVLEASRFSAILSMTLDKGDS